jgi:hypothetical protein
MRREKTQISKIRNKKVEITTNTKVIQGISREYFEHLYFKLENLEEMAKFLDTYDNSKLSNAGSSTISHFKLYYTAIEIKTA